MSAADIGRLRKLSATQWIVVILVVAAAVRLLLVAPLYPLDDEAYYWVWSRNLSLSYFDHPPMVAWLIAAFTSVLGDTPLAIRAPAVLTTLAMSGFGVALARRIYPTDGTQWHYLAFTVVSLVYFANAFVMTPDAPVAAFTAATVWFFYRAVFEGSTRSWYAAGLCFGLALLSKYTAVLWGGALFLFLLSDPGHRRQLRTIHPWAAIALAVLVFAPVIVWNARHEWASFLFQLGHGLPDGKRGAMLEYIGSQAALLTPGVFLVLVGMIIVRLRRWQGLRAQERLLIVATAVPWLFFLYAATKAPVSANWPAFSYFTGLILVAHWQARARRRWQRAVVGVNYLLMVAIVAVLLLQVYFHVLPAGPADVTKRYYGWPEMFDEIEQRAKAYPGAIIVGNIYQVQAQVAYRFGRSDIPALGLDSRPSQYSYMDATPLVGKDLLVIDRAPDLAPLRPYFDSLEEVATIWARRDGTPIRHMKLLYGRNFHPPQTDGDESPVSPTRRSNMR